MTSLTCPNGCGPLGVFVAKRARRQHVYTGCRSCGFADWRGGNTASDICCADSFPVSDPPVDYEVIDEVLGMDPYA